MNWILFWLQFNCITNFNFYRAFYRYNNYNTILFFFHFREHFKWKLLRKFVLCAVKWNEMKEKKRKKRNIPYRIEAICIFWRKINIISLIYIISNLIRILDHRGEYLRNYKSTISKHFQFHTIKVLFKYEMDFEFTPIFR